MGLGWGDFYVLGIVWLSNFIVNFSGVFVVVIVHYFVVIIQCIKLMQGLGVADA